MTTPGDSNPLHQMRLWLFPAVIALMIIAIATSSWALSLNSRIDSLESELSTIRTNASASYYALEPTDSAPTAIRGQVFISITGSGVLTITNAPQPGDNEEYRLWFLNDDDDTIMSNVAFNIDANGQGFALIPADTSGYDRVAVSLEPTESQSPGGHYLLTAQVKSTRG